MSAEPVCRRRTHHKPGEDRGKLGLRARRPALLSRHGLLLLKGCHCQLKIIAAAATGRGRGSAHGAAARLCGAGRLSGGLPVEALGTVRVLLRRRRLLRQSGEGRERRANNRVPAVVVRSWGREGCRLGCLPGLRVGGRVLVPEPRISRGRDAEQLRVLVGEKRRTVRRRNTIPGEGGQLRATARELCQRRHAALGEVQARFERAWPRGRVEFRPAR
jgi:hypothetical protein